MDTQSYGINIEIIDDEYKDMLILALAHQGYQVFLSAPDVVSTVMSDYEVEPIDFNQKPMHDDIN